MFMSSTTSNPLAFGVGARVTISVMSDNYVDIILGALRRVNSDDLVIETGDVSTYIGGSESRILEYLVDLSSLVVKSGKHASINIHLFRGCPGAVSCPKPGPRLTEIPKSRETGQWVAAEWALYPLTDGGDKGADHMRDIYAAIRYAEDNGTFVKSNKSVTRLEGDLGAVVETAMAGWIQVGKGVQHVTSHLTISVNSPSHKCAR